MSDHQDYIHRYRDKKIVREGLVGRIDGEVFSRPRRASTKGTYYDGSETREDQDDNYLWFYFFLLPIVAIMVAAWSLPWGIALALLGLGVILFLTFRKFYSS